MTNPPVRTSTMTLFRDQNFKMFNFRTRLFQALPEPARKAPSVLRSSPGLLQQSATAPREDPNATQFETTRSGWIVPSDILLEIVDCRCLRRNDPSYQVTNRNDPDHFGSVHHGKVANAFVGHHAHALADGVARFHCDQFLSHDILDR